MNSFRWGFVVLGAFAMGAGACSDEPEPVTPIGVGGSGGVAGSGAGAALVCVPGTIEACYSGPPGTQDVGICKSGSRTCLPSGLAFGLCVGEVFPEPEDCTTQVDEACNGSADGCAPFGLHWTKTLGLSGSEVINDVAIDPLTGDIVVVGSFSGGLDFGGEPLTSAGSDDVFVARLSPLGQPLWTKQFGDAASQIATTVAIDASGRIYVGGKVSGTIDLGTGPLQSQGGSDALLATFDDKGNTLWAKLFGSLNDQTLDHVALTNTGNIVVAGRFFNAIGLGGPGLMSLGFEDLFVGVLDASGTHLNSRRFGGPGLDALGGLEVAADGSIFLVGSFSNSIDFGPGIGVLVSSGFTDAFIAKLSANGAAIWAQRVSSQKYDRALAVKVLPSGDITIAGDTTGPVFVAGEVLVPKPDTRILFLAGLSTNGDALWAKMYNAEKSAYLGISLDVDPVTNELLVGGYVDSGIDLGGGLHAGLGGTDIFVARLSADGAYVSSRFFGGPSNEGALTLAANKNGELLLGGAYHGSLDFGSGPLPLPNQLESNAFLVRFWP